MTAAGVETRLEARCALHVDRVAIGTCDRCGSYYCTSCWKQLGAKRLCSACLELPGIDYLAETRTKAWGKRDGWVWYLGGLLSFSALASLIVALQAGHVARALVDAAMAVPLVGYLMLQPWSRNALFAILPLSAIDTVLASHEQAEQQLAYVAGVTTASTLVLGLFLLAARRSPRNKLAFKIEVSDAELARYYDTYVSNPHASRALAYGVLSLLVPLLIPVALVFGILAYRKVDPDAWPPVGRRGSAIVGLVCTGASSLFWTLVVVNLVTR
jgi:hypothetical protein